MVLYGFLFCPLQLLMLVIRDCAYSVAAALRADLTSVPFPADYCGCIPELGEVWLKTWWNFQSLLDSRSISWISSVGNASGPFVVFPVRTIWSTHTPRVIMLQDLI